MSTVLSLKKSIAAAALGAATLFAGGSALAQTAAPDVRKMTQDEKDIVRLYQSFVSCSAAEQPAYEKKVAALQAEAHKIAVKAQQQAKAIMDARAESSEKASIDAAVKAGVPEGDARALLKILNEQEVNAVASIIAGPAIGELQAQLPQEPGAVCMSKLKIDLSVAAPRLKAVIDKHGRAVLEAPVGPAPK